MKVKVLLVAGVVILLVLLITPGVAAPGTTTMVIAVQDAVAVGTVGVVGGGGPVLIPRRPAPRSPYTPPSWVPYGGPTRGGSGRAAR